MRGLFYSTIVMLLIAPLILLTLVNLNIYQSSSETTATKIVGEKLAAYSRSIDEDLPRAMDIMAKRAITQALVYIETNGTALHDSSAVLTELITNGTIYGNMSSIDFTTTSWSQILRDKGLRYGFDTDIRVVEVKFFSIDSYNIGAQIAVSVNVTSSFAEMQLYRIYNKTVPVLIEGFNDPIYTIKTNGILKRNIARPNITISGRENFDKAVASGFYMPSQQGAGFLERLEGRLGSSGKYSTGIDGLESVVYVPALQANGIPLRPGQTQIDYLYFDPASYAGGLVNGSSYSWLRIDSTHASTYNITIL